MDWFDQGDTARLDADYDNFFDETEVDELATGPAMTRDKTQRVAAREPATQGRSSPTSAMIVEPLPGTLEVEEIKVASEPVSITSPNNKKGDL